MSYVQEIKNQIDALWFKVGVTAGICANNTDLKSLQEKLEKAESYTGYARTVAEFSANPKISAQLNKAYSAIGKVKEPIAKLSSVCVDITAANEVSNAIGVLNQWVAPGSKLSNAEAAAAFDRLFGGLARFAEKLPPPVNAYAAILSEIALTKFFTNMQRELDPMTNSARGAQLREIMDSL